MYSSYSSHSLPRTAALVIGLTARPKSEQQLDVTNVAASSAATANGVHNKNIRLSTDIQRAYSCENM